MLPASMLPAPRTVQNWLQKTAVWQSILRPGAVVLVAAEQQAVALLEFRSLAVAAATPA